MFKVWVTRIMPNKTISEKCFSFDSEKRALEFFNDKVTEFKCKVVSRRDYDWIDGDPEVINIRSKGKNVDVTIFNESFRHHELFYT
jgi:hypothetical protein